MDRRNRIEIMCPCPEAQCEHMGDDGKCNGRIAFFVVHNGVIPLCAHYAKAVLAKMEEQDE